MREIIEVFFEIDREKLKVVSFNSFVNALLIFLVVFFFLANYDFKIYASLIISVIGFFASFYHYRKRYSLDFIEGKNPDFREILKTAKDNLREQNIVVEIFFREVVSRVRNLSLTDLINVKGLSFRIGLIVLMTFLIFLIPATEVARNNIISGLLSGLQAQGSGLTGIALKKSDDIFGKPTLINLGTKELQISIQQANNELDFSKVREVQRREFSRNEFVTDVEAVADVPSNEKLPEDYDLIKAYNLRIR